MAQLIEENKIELKAINDILSYNFLIPSYQRGYRWTKRQIINLLDDIWDYAQNENNNDPFYCLQPIVVTDKNKRWELIDGQQRLTTIFIILSFLNAEDKFEIEFETRTESKDFLSNLKNEIDDKNIDFYHISLAYSYVTNWFDQKRQEGLFYVKDKFKITLLEKTKIIWYQVNDGTDPRDIFTRINMGKIPLTNAELTKALFLRSNNFEQDEDIIRLKQLKIAGEWDRIEYSLQNDEFWYFINKEENDLATRIELIFDLMAGKTIVKDDYFTFQFFNKKFHGNSINTISNVWKEIKDYFMTFEEWFNERNFYHLIGYLIAIGVEIKNIKSASKDKTKSEFKDFLIKEIKKRVNHQIFELDYEKDRKTIEKILLLFNIQTILSNEMSLYRFPFDRFKDEKWSLEHIHAQNSEGLITVNQWTSWIDEHINSLNRIDPEENKDLILEMTEKINQGIKKEIFDELFSKVMRVFETEQLQDEMHDISNLALLDKDSNSALNKAIFEIKKRRIIEREKTGAFIPICTRNVFLKYYSNNASQLYFWGQEDRADYMEAIKEILKDYLPIQTEEMK